MPHPEQSLGGLLQASLARNHPELTAETRMTIVAGLQGLVKKTDDDIAAILPGLDDELRSAMEQAAASERAERVANLVDVIRTANSRLNTSTLLAVREVRKLRAQLATVQQRLKGLNQVKTSAASGNVADLIAFAYPELLDDLLEAQLIGPFAKPPAPAKKTTRK